MRRAVVLLTAALVLGMPGPAFADHDYGGDQNYEDQWSNEDRNRNRGRDRGAFSPGPFTDSPVTIQICAVPDSCPQNPPQNPPQDRPAPEDRQR